MNHRTLIRYWVSFPGLAASLGVFLLGGCKPSPPVPAGGGKLFGVSFQTMNNPFFVDLNKGLQAAILSGKLHSTSAQFPREIGRLAAEAAYDHLAGKPVVKNIVVPVKLITKENAASILEAK